MTQICNFTHVFHSSRSVISSHPKTTLKQQTSPVTTTSRRSFHNQSWCTPHFCYNPWCHHAPTSESQDTLPRMKYVTISRITQLPGTSWKPSIPAGGPMDEMETMEPDTHVLPGQSWREKILWIDFLELRTGITLAYFHSRIVKNIQQCIINSRV